jgi:hypothetical protein
VQRSVNRKVQGSNPCPGAKSDLELGLAAFVGSSLTTTALQPHYNRLSRWPAYAGLPIDITAANIEGFADCLYVDRSNA